MRASKQISIAQYQSVPTLQTPRLPSILAQAHQRTQGIYVMRWSLRGIVEKLRKAIRIEIPIGYQDEAGFHLGVEPAEKEVKSCRFGSFPPRRRVAYFNKVHRRGKTRYKLNQPQD
jgi:hypothetical protein